MLPMLCDGRAKREKELDEKMQTDRRRREFKGERGRQTMEPEVV